MSFQGSSQTIDVTFDSHKVQYQATTVRAVGTASNVTIRFTSTSRITFPISVICSNSAGTSAVAFTGTSYIGTTQADYNVLGLTLIAAAGNTVAIQVLAYTV